LVLFFKKEPLSWFLFADEFHAIITKSPRIRAVGLLTALALAGCVATPPACPPPGVWLSPADLRTVPDPVPAAANRAVVLLGEQHDSAADHRWELATIEGLYTRNRAMVLGFEMFPRDRQAVLDRWVRGELSEAAFLAQSDWTHVWGFDAGFYMPIFRFARDRHIPMLALNVSRRLVHLVAARGWARVAPALREGVGDPAPASPAYEASLRDAMSGHGAGAGGGMAMTPERLRHFIEAQLLWDRAMAEKIAASRTRAPGATVVAIMGAGHLENRWGVPHQLAALGVTDTVVLLPAHGACKPLGPFYADAVYSD
jgi:uncharacterized iron-regulated protein